MKSIIHKAIYWALPLLTLPTTGLLLQSCEEDKAEKWVDLRYRVEDSYVIQASNPEPFSFEVKSTDSWEVFGKYDWYTLSPSTGEAGKTCTVTVACKENTALDDRIDTIHIKSDYWTGKRFVLTQKGTAYLNVEDVEMINQEGDAMTFNVLSNQKWSAKVTEGDIWLSIRGNDGKIEGEQNGQITVEATPNTGEMRTGVVTIYDRHGKVAMEVKCTQDGVLLTPETPVNGKWFAIYEQEQELKISIESNAEWTVYKENELDDTWYDFEKTSFSGSEELVIKVSEHTGSSVRTGTIILATKAAEGATPLTKTVKFKQANPKRPEVHNMDVTLGTQYGPSSLMPGRYNFYFEPFNANFELFFMWGDVELRFHVSDNITLLSTRPWCSDVFDDRSDCRHTVDSSQPNVLSFELQESVTPTGSWLYTEWILNNKIIAKATSDGVSDADGTGDTWKVPFSQLSSGGTFLVRATSGSLVFTKWEYVAPLNWGD